MSVAKTQDPYNIAIAFCQYYYNLVNSGHNKLFQLYTSDAIINHTDCDNAFKKTENITGHEAIKAHWSKSQLAGSKIMISTVDAQSSWNNSILIICVGELVTGFVDDDENAPSHKFVQTFVLVPSGKSTYDIFNDYLRFIPDVDDEEVEDIIVEEPVAVEEEKVEEEEEEEEEVASNGTPVSEEASEEKETTSTSTEPETKPAERGVSSSSESPKATSPAAAVGKEVTLNGSSKETAEASEPKSNGDKKSIEVSATPAKPTTMNWASAAAISVKTSAATNTTIASTAATVAATTTPATPVTAAAKPAKPVVKKSDDKSGASSSTSSSSVPASAVSEGSSTDDSSKKDDLDEFILAGGKKHKTSFVNRKGDAVFPVYIKGIPEGMPEPELVAFLEEKFGKVETCKVSKAVALVDFTKSGSQVKAINCRNAVLKGQTMVIEPRTVKPALKDSKDKKKKPRSFDGDGYKKVGK